MRVQEHETSKITGHMSNRPPCPDWLDVGDDSFSTEQIFISLEKLTVTKHALELYYIFA